MHTGTRLTQPPFTVHRSPFTLFRCTVHAFRPKPHLALERLEPGAVGFPASAHHEITGGELRLEVPPPNFLELPSQTITGHRTGLKLGNNQSDPRVTRCVVQPDHVEVLGSLPASFGETATKVRCSSESSDSREPLTRRQRPPCFEGMRTVRRFRPFLRRRDSTARPQRVAIRARKPCLLRRRLLRGR
jgi:hypothetical protein